MAKRRRTTGGGEQEGGAHWMDTYGDLITLVLCFFVLLFSFSSIDARKWEAIVGAFSGTTAAAIPVLDPMTVMEPPIKMEPTTGETSESEHQEAIDIATLLELAAAIGNYISENNLEGQVELHTNFEHFVLIIRFSDNVLFDSGSDVLHAEARETLDHIIDALAQNMSLIHMIRIEGHTDNRPIRTQRFDSNWELSVFRAVRALRYLIDSEKIARDKISAVGYGEYQPIAPNTTPEGQARNRRVDFMVETVRGPYTY